MDTVDVASDRDEWTRESLETCGAEYSEKVLILDSDQESLYDENWQISLRASGWKLMYFSFFHEHRFHADIVLNQNIRAPELSYRTAAYTQLLLGTQYVILNDSFRQVAEKQSLTVKKEGCCMLFFGGADGKGLTVRVLSALLNHERIFKKLIVVVGALNPDRTAIEKLCAQANSYTELHVNTPEMPQLMTSCEYAITSGGLTLWELATLNVLQLVIPTSERERLTVAYCEEKGLVYHYQGEVEAEALFCWIQTVMSESNHKSMVAGFQREVGINGVGLVATEIVRLFESDGENNA
ncbi:MAG: hypothetical protein Roseis2KO_02040 [Roseivirga sp.]